MSFLLFVVGPSPVSSPAGADSLFFVLPKKSKQKKGAPEMATSPWIFVTGRRWGKLASLRQFPIFFPPAYKNPRRHQGQERQKKKANPSRGRPLSFWLASRWFGSLPLTFPALCGALNFCERAEKGRRLFERSEFASFPARSRKFKESFAASGAPFFAYFLWQDKESESAPAGDETGVNHQR
ncbi:hypothetical protein PQH03_03285 [Ralstonia insidiosa]|uniref:hypothetical protein n=1 Tax=Ralstonia TaxID=48736 RepID=UPI00200B1C0E|nr:hypothetical protein [Ralstonia insidiosa]MCK8652888.1 hypothetical protein [Ralstonia insidiosa]MDE4923648.1 hypothetical protein [Ralstonia insidiosa]